MAKPATRNIKDFLFDSVEYFMTAFTPHATVRQGDMPNYNDIGPVIQTSEVLYFPIAHVPTRTVRTARY
ncbi:MAG: hypothetical protein EPN17_15935 [Methylobacter sp.]|nr:MAG: hypothetical protein EPN17_15935 [Methylobacter sp.]